MSHVFRRWHRWVSILIALPLLVMLGSGLILAVRGFSSWMQPVYPASSTSELKVTFEQILAAARTVPEAGIRTWADVSQIDARPASGQIRLRAKRGHWEVQVDSVTGAVLGSGQRRVSWFIQLHEGTLFGSWVRYGIFLPSAFGALFLLLSGIVIAAQPWLLRGRRKGIAAGILIESPKQGDPHASKVS